MLRMNFLSGMLLASAIFLLAVLFSSIISIHSTRAQSDELPVIKDSRLKAELVFKGLKFPTSMAFLGPNDILVLEKNDGTVRRIVNGVMLSNPVLHVNVANKYERGLLGIAVAKHNEKSDKSPQDVFLYFTESKVHGGDDCPSSVYCKPGTAPEGNRLYRYQFVDNKLVNPKLLLDLPAIPGPQHNGGAIMIGPDGNLYVPIGNAREYRSHATNTTAENVQGGSNPDGRSGISRITQNGETVKGKGILGAQNPLNKYYAYGIRNSFGIDFDPLTGKLWDTENGPEYGDEINLFEPGFNSGWDKIQGVWKPKPIISLANATSIDPYNATGDLKLLAGKTELNPTGLVDFGGKGKYSAPEFIWNQPRGLTALKFLSSDKLGKEYQNDMSVGSTNDRRLYHFDLDKNRTGLSLRDTLADKIANSSDDLQQIDFGQDIGGITDLEVGPDGFLYVLTLANGISACDMRTIDYIHDSNCIQSLLHPQGSIFRILPKELPVVKDPRLKVEEIGHGLSDSPSSMDFLDNDHILVLQKGDGSVRLISNGTLEPQPVLKVPIKNTGEQGLLGIAVDRDNFDGLSAGRLGTGAANKSKTTVFLYFTESDAGKPTRNRVYGFQWNGTKLINPTLILDLPASLPGTGLENHAAGKLLIGPDNYLYAVIGDLNHKGQLQNIKDGPAPDNTSVILRVNPVDGTAAKDNPFVSNGKNDNDKKDNSATSTTIGRYYGYGIRNSFGLAFDPVTGDIWDTENGAAAYDEINLVKPGFNSGWVKVMGPISGSYVSKKPLFNMTGSRYIDPVFSWKKTVGVTGIDFMKSSKLGGKYLNNIFVGDYNSGNLYYFKVNETRTGINFDGNQTGLSDLVADNPKEVSDITFGRGFGSITDVKSGPDGFLYVLDFGSDSIFRIRPSN
jgi:glucose/arabinose dehydrogenase